MCPYYSALSPAKPGFMATYPIQDLLGGPLEGLIGFGLRFKVWGLGFSAYGLGWYVGGCEFLKSFQVRLDGGKGVQKLGVLSRRNVDT